MKLSEIPRHEAGEGLEEYLRHVLNTPSVSIGDLARWLDVQRTALCKIQAGGGASIDTITKFGALTGVLERTPARIETLNLFGVLESAEAGWAMRAKLLAEN